MNARIIVIGDELLLGDTQDTNTYYLIQQCRQLGIAITQYSGVADRPASIVHALADNLENTDLTLLTGGLGPTPDDLTLAALAQHLGLPLTPHPDAQAHVESYQRRRKKSTPYAEKLWQLPKGATALPNPAGLAPGVWITHQNHHYIALVGVPVELKALFTQQVAPKLTALRHTNPTPIPPYAYFHTINISESELSQRIGNLHLQGVQIAYLPKLGWESLRLQADNATVLQTAAQTLQTALHDHIYSTEIDQTPAQALSAYLVEQQQTLAIAESCTGGYLTHLFTQYSGASAYLLGSVVSYSPAAKAELGVPEDIIRTAGPVSEAVVQHMARNVQQRYGATIGLAVSGTLSPSHLPGYTHTDGDVWVACAVNQHLTTAQYRVVRNREANIVTAAHATIGCALAAVWKNIKAKKPYIT